MIPKRASEIAQFVERVPAPAPVDIDRRLQALGYKGQDQARRALALVAYRHVRRLKRLHLDQVPRTEIGPKPNTLLVGPTGCGKTFLVELLFSRIMRLPTVVVDVTGFSETGYIGADAVTILTQLVQRANDNPAVAATGVVCLDEFDKLASTSNHARFDGEGSTKDVSGMGVQKELLRMMEVGEVTVPLDHNNSSYSGKVAMRTDDVTFLACGAFSGLKTIANRSGSATVGFRATPGGSSTREGIAVRYDESELNHVDNFQRYGFLPELIGRFSRIVPLEPLGRDTLREILEENVLTQFNHEFRDEGHRLKVSERVLTHIVDRAVERETGARGLTAILTRILEKAAYETFGQPSSNVTVDLDDHAGIAIKKRRRRARRR